MAPGYAGANDYSLLHGFLGGADAGDGFGFFAVAPVAALTPLQQFFGAGGFVAVYDAETAQVGIGSERPR